jgi:hypothetical protein
MKAGQEGGQGGNNGPSTGGNNNDFGPSFDFNKLSQGVADIYGDNGTITPE